MTSLKSFKGAHFDGERFPVQRTDIEERTIKKIEKILYPCT